MAGSFGYETEHYDISRRAGGRRLIPRVKEDHNSAVIAPGVSCRQQISDFAGRRALHPAEALFERALADEIQGFVAH